MMRSITTFTGKRFVLSAPMPSMVDIIDIGHSLSLQTRFTGHVREFYPVAQHCVLACDQALLEGASRLVALQTLLHDSPEAYTSDLSRPLKYDLGRTFAQYEQRIYDTICEAMGIPATLPVMVSVIDNRLLATEARDLMNGSLDDDGMPLAEPYDFTVIPWDCKTAFREFMARFNELEG